MPAQLQSLLESLAPQTATSFPTTITVRDATVGPLFGTSVVSGCAIVTSS